MADMRKGAIIIGKRVIIGLLIFYLTTIVNIVSQNIGKDNGDYQVCINCIDRPFSCN